MYSNWEAAIQIKHLSLDISLAESIVNGVSSDRIVIVCKDAEKDVIVSLLSQIGWRSHIQSIVTENDLIKWYESLFEEIIQSSWEKNFCIVLLMK
ncbi:MAG: HaeII family restriction endonuclease [Phocaeicola vulgatus]|nr:MAG: HaeII family restriction endonuclease [Phocaeicola vulgatus]